MTTQEKPKYCGQNWLEMKPNDNGRICGQCKKKIIDFSKMSWADIDRIQQANNNSLCGMYKPKQLDFWGKEIPSKSTNVIKAVTIVGLCISLANSAFSQTILDTDSFVVRGKIIDKQTSESVPFAKVTFKNLKDSTTSDFDGNFKMVIKNLPKKVFPETIEVKFIGYLPTQLIFKDLNELRNIENVISSEGIKLGLTPNINTGITFYVPRPTLGQRVKWKLKKWFRRKEK